jgi:hypothetical protein
VLIPQHPGINPEQGSFKGTDLPNGYNSLFAGSGECLLCHNSMTDLEGNSISIMADWRSSMLANAARDPFWQAKVSHEGLVNPGHKEVLEDVCTKCHAPVGQINAHHNGQALYSLSEMQDDSLAMDGIQCTVCHQITEGSLGNFSGSIEIGGQKKIWGPYPDPFTNPMVINTGYTPAYSNHINDSRLCGSCHTLITHSVDLNGVPTGEEFVEQAIYQEWENSTFPDDNISCQSCHVPRIDDPVKISLFPWWLTPKSPFGLHQFAGANVFMSKILKANADEIGVTATATQFDSTIARSTRMLQEQSLELELSETARQDDTLFISLLLKNKAGHKFPAGYPSRRAFIEVIAITPSNDTIFHSGKMDNSFHLIGENPEYENHYDKIDNEDDLQIYEFVMGDVNADVTTVLERAYQPLKDNRIPPKGFYSNHNNYDTVRIVGNAINDPNFNKTDGQEGSGSDQIRYHISLQGHVGSVNVYAKIHYQSVSSKWLENMFSYSSDEIDAFKSYYENADLIPVEVAHASWLSKGKFSIHLKQGWNSLSTCLLPEDESIENMLAGIINSVQIMESGEGIFYPSGGINTIGPFDPYQGYSIKLNNQETLEITGYELANNSLALESGWNILPVLTSCIVEIDALNSDFHEQLEIIVELAGDKVYWPEKNISSLTVLFPGKAYLVKMHNSSEIVFPACETSK